MLQASYKPNILQKYKTIQKHQNDVSGRRQNKFEITVVVCGASSHILGKQWKQKQKDVDIIRCKCIKVGVSCLALCVWTVVIGKGARQNSTVWAQEVSGRGAVGVVSNQHLCVGGFFCREANADNETRTAGCARVLPLASDAVAFHLPVITGHTQFCVAGIGISLFSGTPRTWVKRAHSAPFGTPGHRLVS